MYVTSGWGIHDERWTSALRTLGFAPTIVRLGIDVHTSSALRAQVERDSAGGIPVLAGPVNTVAVHLRNLPTRVVGLSWGFDIHQMGDRPWLTDLDGLIVDSSATSALARAAGVDAEAITFLPWGVDLGVFHPAGPHADVTRWQVPRGARTLLSLRAHEPLYRVSDILDGFAQVSQEFPDVHLIVGHSGSLTPELQERAHQHGISDRTHFVGTLSEDELPEVLRAVDVYVSASEVDGTSGTLLQALACGTSVVASDTPGNQPWIIPGETGFVFTTGDAAALAQTLRSRLTSTNEEILALKARGRLLVEREADWQRNLPRLAQALGAPGSSDPGLTSP
ncbi:MAG TPA: glycosyltransferase [Acidimicrobiia bacterium]